MFLPIGDKMEFRSQKGAAMVEFAIVLPLLLIMVFGIIEFGLILYDKAMITNASREGARAGIVYVDSSGGGSCLDQEQIGQVVNNYCANHLISFGGDPENPTVPDTVAVGNCVTGTPLSVTVTYNYGFLVLPNFISELAGGINLTAQTVMRYE